jgi:hypothetical protein
MASAFVLHAWIAMDAVVSTKQFKDEMTALARIGWRLSGIVVLVILLYGAYVRAQHVIGFTVGDVGVTVPAQQVERGDAVLCRFLEPGADPALKRGDLVLVRVRKFQANYDIGNGIYDEYVGDQVGQLIALPGDELGLTPGGFTVNGRALDPLKFAVPPWLKAYAGGLSLGKNEYFVTMEYQAQGHGQGGASEIKLACVHGRPELLARGVMRWLPMRKRGFLKELE